VLADILKEIFLFDLLVLAMSSKDCSQGEDLPQNVSDVEDPADVSLPFCGSIEIFSGTFISLVK